MLFTRRLFFLKRKGGNLRSDFFLKLLYILQPLGRGGIGGHTPVTAGRQAHIAYLRTVWHAGTLELLVEESAEEVAQPF